MCQGGDCPLKSSCYRYLATPEKVHQTYFGAIPYSVENGNTTCQFYWEVSSDENQDDPT